MADDEYDRLMLGLETAWGIIANACAKGSDWGNWDSMSPEWVTFAAKWRDEHWHAALNRRALRAAEGEPAPTPEWAARAGESP
jgi:hypothetical protein